MDIHTSALGASEAPSRTDSVQYGTEHTAPYARPSLDVFIICGPSGVGKGTIIDHLLRTYPDTFGFSISHTTRAPRPGEIDGVHYHFVHESQMRCEIDQGNFLEFANVHGRMYGTSKQAVLHVIESLRRICILDIDLQGLRSLYDQRESLPFTFKVLFVRPPNIDTLQTRLERRGSESREDISVRMETAEQEMRVITENPELFDSVIENCELNHCISDIVNTLRSWGAHGV